VKTELDKAFDLLNEKTVNINFAMDFLGMSKRDVRKLCCPGVLDTYVMDDGSYRIVSKSLNAYAKSRIEKIK